MDEDLESAVVCGANADFVEASDEDGYMEGLKGSQGVQKGNK